jgi:GDP-L-fucose synthase
MIQTNTINAAYENGVNKLLMIGSTCVYPKFAPNPITEDMIMTGALEPTNEPYAIAKIAAIKMCESYNRQYGTDYRTVLPCNLFGPGDNYHPENGHVTAGIINTLHQAKLKDTDSAKIWGTGTPRREFLYSDDLAEAIYIILKSPKKKLFKICNNNFPIINVGSGDFYTIKKLANLIKKKIDFKGKIIFDKKFPNGVMNKNLSSTRIKKLNWKPSVKLRNGIDIVLNDLNLRN